jgi:hypothetical protein
MRDPLDYPELSRLQGRIDAAGARNVAAMRAWRLDRGLDNPKRIDPVPDARVTAEYFATRDAYRAALAAHQTAFTARFGRVKRKRA